MDVSVLDLLSGRLKEIWRLAVYSNAVLTMVVRLDEIRKLGTQL